MKHKITLKEALSRIPPSEFYCYWGEDVCPYHYVRKFSKNRWIKEVGKHNLFAVPSDYGEDHRLEYCSLLKCYLSIQDYVKDCGINTHEQMRLKYEKEFYNEIFPEDKKLVDKIIKEDKK